MEWFQYFLFHFFFSFFGRYLEVDKRFRISWSACSVTHNVPSSQRIIWSKYFCIISNSWKKYRTEFDKTEFTYLHHQSNTGKWHEPDSVVFSDAPRPTQVNAFGKRRCKLNSQYIVRDVIGTRRRPNILNLIFLLLHLSVLTDSLSITQRLLFINWSPEWVTNR